MISVITCAGSSNSYEKVLLPSLHRVTKFLWENEFDALDVIKVKGSDFRNIAEAYNYGLGKAVYPIKAFIHDDLDMLNPNWVFKVLRSFSINPNCGLLGLVGSKKVNNYDNWWEHEDGIYGDQLIRKDQCIIRGFELPEEGVFGLDVVDGCFLATNREVKFDENLKYDGFLSAYEHDICMYFKSKKLDIGVIKHMTWHVCSVQGKIREKYIFEDYRKKWKIT